MRAGLREGGVEGERKQPTVTTQWGKHYFNDIPRMSWNLRQGATYSSWHWGKELSGNVPKGKWFLNCTLKKQWELESKSARSGKSSRENHQQRPSSDTGQSSVRMRFRVHISRAWLQQGLKDGQKPCHEEPVSHSEESGAQRILLCPFPHLLNHIYDFRYSTDTAVASAISGHLKWTL